MEEGTADGMPPHRRTGHEKLRKTGVSGRRPAHGLEITSTRAGPRLPDWTVAMNPSWLSYLLCLIVWTGAVFELLLIAVKAVTGTLASEPLVGTLLTRSSGADRVAPITILLLLAWVLIESLLHALRARREAGAVRQFVAAVDGSGSAQGFREVTGRTRAARRARLTGELQLSPEALHDMLPGTSSLDGQEIDGFYGHLRVYVWTLPVVGFIGTAWGMSHSIPGFSAALTPTTNVR